MSEVKLSIFASAIRPHLWKEFLNSLKGGKYAYEVVFAGFIDEELYKPFMDEFPEFRYIQTDDIKPAQCYEVARRNCTGDLVCWIADDCRFSYGFIDIIVEFFKPLHESIQKSYIISCRTNENDQNETMENHRFFGRNRNTPRMAPIGIMRRDKLEEMGGLDRRYICGQYENDICMRMYSEGGEIIIYNGVCVSIDHKNAHGSETNFWNGYNEDREQLENSWVIGGYVPSPAPFFITPKNPKEYAEFEKDPSKFWYVPLNNTEVTLKRNDKFEGFEDKDLLTKSQSRKGQWK